MSNYADRKVGRDALLAQIIADVNDFQASYDHLPNQFDKQSPVLVVESGTRNPDGTPAEIDIAQYLVQIWVAREYPSPEEDEDFTDDRDACEDILDDYSTRVLNSMMSAGAYQIPGETTVGYDIVDGMEYKFELYFVFTDLHA